MWNGFGAFAQATYDHGMFWGRLTLGDRITEKLKWEVYLQSRYQNDPAEKKNIFAHHQTTNYWLWLHYQMTKELRVSVTPFCYFSAVALYPQPASLRDRAVNEYRWSIQAEHSLKGKHLIFANRYALEYRLRDLSQENVYTNNYRVRYRARLEYPLKKMGNAMSLILFDEVFFEFGEAVKPSPVVFSQNRLYAGVSYEVMKNVKFTVAYMNVYLARSSGNEFDNASVLWAILAFDNVFSQFKRKDTEIEK